MKVHVLPGDALAAEFAETGIGGETIVCREALVDGDVSAASLDDFWRVRARFVEKNYGEAPEKYRAGVIAEFERLQDLAAAPAAEINLWFEHELFCQANFWFCLAFLSESGAKIYRVAPVVRNENDIWKGFGGLRAADLEKCFAGRIALSPADVRRGADLWRAFQTGDFELLEKLSETESAAFPHLEEVCRAAAEKGSRPKEVLESIIAEGKTDFAEIFPAFSARAGVYGFGDAQVQRILAQL